MISFFLDLPLQERLLKINDLIFVSACFWEGEGKELTLLISTGFSKAAQIVLVLAQKSVPNACGFGRK